MNNATQNLSEKNQEFKKEVEEQLSAALKSYEEIPNSLKLITNRLYSDLEKQFDASISNLNSKVENLQFKLDTTKLQSGIDEYGNSLSSQAEEFRNLSKSLTVNAQQTREDIQKSLQNIPNQLETELRQQFTQCVDAFSNKLQELRLVLDTKPIQASIDGYRQSHRRSKFEV